MKEREFKYIDMDRINEQVESGEVSPADEPSTDVLYDTLLDLLQLAHNEGMTEEEIDAVVRRVNDYRAERVRDRFRLHTN